jgi:hypothetical protein
LRKIIKLIRSAGNWKRDLRDVRDGVSLIIYVDFVLGDGIPIMVACLDTDD